MTVFILTSTYFFVSWLLQCNHFKLSHNLWRGLLVKKVTKDVYVCGVELTTDILGGKWRIMILWYLRKKSLRFGQLKRSLKGISEKVLSQELKQLTELGLIDKKVYYQKPLKVEYSLTNYGRTFLPTLYSIFEWGAHYAEIFNIPLIIDEATIDEVLNEKERFLLEYKNNKLESVN
ncbi:transcriptional regulator [Clostridium tetani]|nr:transcriptional regulator [Clostridium tetani]RXM60106.1 transcriptional regulator [Clostridium tetani]RXM66350.1 transcriptional regulator [Clostridium tetani]